MCGILFYFSKNLISNVDFCQALDLQSHRGPDHTGVFYTDIKESKTKIFNLKELLKNKGSIKHNVNSNFFIGHKRLSVFDLSSRSNQPFINKNTNDFFIYNGEFYNFKDYASNENINSDGLTLFENITKYGPEFYNRVNGMWASIHSDFKNNKVFLSRDRYGKKPLYYYNSKDTFIASSEIKSIFALLKQSRKVNLNALSYFFSSKMSPFFNNGTTFYDNINSIKPGENIYLDLNTFNLKFHSNIEHFENKINFKNNFNLVEENFNHEFNSAVHLRLQTDRKASVLLSGGVDSSLIASFIKKKDLEKLVFYTIYSKNEDYKNSDLYYSRLLAKNLDLKLNEISNDIELNEIDQIFYKLSKQQENPINLSSTALPTFLISSKMKSDNMHIALDGVGGDEIMGGFPVFSSLATASLKNKQYIKSMNYINQFLKYNDFNFIKNVKYFLHIMYSGLINHNFLSHSQKRSLSLLEILSNKLIKQEIRDLTLKNERDNLFLQTDRQNYEINKGGLPYYLGVSDSSNMINTVESRSPFLDSRLNKFLDLPDELKYNNGFNKFFLRSLLSKRVSNEIAWRKNKKGFTTHGIENYIQNNKSIEKILDSKIVREIIDKNININKLRKNKKALNALLPLAILNDIYDLHI